MAQRTCSIDGCERAHKAKGFCSKHYMRHLLHGSPHTVLRSYGATPAHERKPCAFGGCDGYAKSRGFCGKHYQRWWRYGDASIARVNARPGCSVAGCSKPHAARGCCEWHYSALRRCGRYGITPARYFAMIEAQRFVCAICGLPPAGAHAKDRLLHIDHDHRTGKVRGLLCGSCNRGIGSLRDSTSNLRSAIRYLEGSDERAPLNA